MGATLCFVPRTPDGALPRDARLSVRVTSEDLAVLDGLRGGIERSDYVRSLIHSAATAGKRATRHP